MKPDNARLGILLMVLASLVFAIQDAVSRHLASHYDIVTIVGLRFWFFAAFTVSLTAIRRGGIGKVLRTAQPWTQTIRALLLLASIWVMISSFVTLGLIESHALYSICPLLVVALAGPMLGERIGWRRWSAVLVGMMGMVVILRPGHQVFSPAAILPLSGALIFAFYVILTRRVSTTDSAETTFFYTGVIGAVATTLVMPFFWTPMQSAADWGWMGLLCATAAISHFVLIKAYQVAQVGTVQPFAYSQFLFAGLLGVIFFGEFPDGWTLIGGGLIVAAGVYALLNESRSAREVSLPASGAPPLIDEGQICRVDRTFRR